MKNAVDIQETLEKHKAWLLDNSDGERANLRGANLEGADLQFADLARAHLEGAHLEGANLRGANLRVAHLCGAHLEYAKLKGADLALAHLEGANLRGANLRGANLYRANLARTNFWSCIGNMFEIKSLQLDLYEIAYTAEDLQIGCQKHPITEWWDFTDDVICSMDRHALMWWQVWKEPLRKIIELSPARPTRLDNNNRGDLE